MHTYILRSPQGDPGDTRHFFQAETDQSFPRFAFRSGLNFVEGSCRSRIFLLLGVVMVMVMSVVVVFVVGDNFFDGSWHLNTPRSIHR